MAQGPPASDEPRRRRFFWLLEELPTRRASWVLVILVLAVQFAATTFVNLVVFRRPWLDPLARATVQLVQPTLVVNLAQFALNVIIVMLVVGRLRPRDVGLVAPRLLDGVVVTAAVWLIAQVLVMITSLVMSGGVATASLWRQTGVPFMLGRLLAQLAGNALTEEVVYRGFLPVQILWLLGYREDQDGRHKTMALLLALLISQGIFALSHIPNQIWRGSTLPATVQTLGFLLAVGIFYALLYLRTANLFVVVGVHALINTPTPLITSEGYLRGWLWGLAITLFFAWPHVARGLRGTRVRRA